MKSLMNALFLTLLLVGAARAEMGDKSPRNPPSRSVTSAPGAPGMLSWGMVLGGGYYDTCMGLALDGSGNIYVTGYTSTPGWISGGYDTGLGGDNDAFVVKLTLQGQHLWSTYLGGSGKDQGLGVAVTPAGTCYVVGLTYSSGWTALGDNTTLKGKEDGFLVKLSSGGQLLWSTYLGGTGSYGDECRGVALDGAGNCYVAGMTYSLDWFTGSNGTSNQGGGDAFAVKFTPDGQRAWGTYLGGPQRDQANAIALDPAGNVCLTGSTTSWTWAAGGYDLTQGGSSDGFVAKLSPTGKPLWSTYLGGSGNDYGYAIANDAAGNIYAAGTTNSAGWAAGGYDTVHIPITTSANSDAFVIKLSPQGQHVWSTYLGGVDQEEGRSIALDPAGNIFVGGKTVIFTEDWMFGGARLTNGGSSDGFVAKLSPQGRMLWGSCVGGNADDDVKALAADGNGGIEVAGFTASGNWLKGGTDPSYSGDSDGFVARLSDGQPIPACGIRVVIRPDDIANAGARWQVVGTKPWNMCDEILTLPAPGLYEIQFYDVASWQKPSNITVEVKDGQITTAYVSYKTPIDLSLLTPQLLTVKPGQRAATAVIASGLSPLSFQWKYNGVDISGATGTTLAIAACRFADAGVYSCEVSNPYTRVVSPPVRLVVCGGGSVLAYLLGLSEDPAGLDLNTDGKINVGDVLAGNKLSPPAASAGPPALKAGTVGRDPQP